MSPLEQQVRRAQHRLWVNGWFDRAAWCVTVAAAALAAGVFLQRAFDLEWPLRWIGAGPLAGSLAASLVWTFLRRESAETAAAALDEAAGLRERLSSGRYCVGSDDPFERAVLADADAVSAGLSVRAHLRYSVPPGLGYGGAAVVLAALMFLVPVGFLRGAAAQVVSRQTVEARQARTLVKKRLDDVLKVARNNPALEDLKADLEDAKDGLGIPLQKPEVVRNAALKKLDRLADAIQQKKADPKYGGLNEFRKMTRGLQLPKPSDAMTQKLAKALSEGDFKTAREEVQAMREQLATLKADQDKQMVDRLSKQLEDLAKQLEQASGDKQLMQKLEQAGIKKEDVQRMLENLSKQDLDQVRKQLAEKGMNQQQIEKLVKQLQQKQQAGSTAKQMSKALKQASQCNTPGQMGEAMGGLSQAADQLSDLEMLEAEMSQLQSTLESVNQAQDDLSKPCPQCNGTGQVNGGTCSRCNGSGQSNGGMGRKPGQGRGGIAPERKTGVGFQVVRGKVHTGKGAIIGQFLVDGEQKKGDASSELSEIVTAAERDATDAINRDRVPRQYQKAVKEYFSNVRDAVREKASKGDKEAGDGQVSEDEAGDGRVSEDEAGGGRAAENEAGGGQASKDGNGSGSGSGSGGEG